MNFDRLLISLSILLFNKVFLFFLVIILVSCGRKNTLIGVLDRPLQKTINPGTGYAYIPSGTMSIEDEIISNSYIQRIKTVSIPGFYMKQREVTNKEYFEFVNWVKDSLAHTYLNHFIRDENNEIRIDWKINIDWEAEELKELFYHPNNSSIAKREINNNKLIFTYEYYDWESAARDRGESPRNSFIKRINVNIYPDLSVWNQESSLIDNSEEFGKSYFLDSRYKQFPVVGINHNQAKSYCQWLMHRLYTNSDMAEIRLPTELEWEYAASGDSGTRPTYPWGDQPYNYRTNKNGKLTINFACNSGGLKDENGSEVISASADRAEFTSMVDSYAPNKHGLYNMAGNVAEWTLSNSSEVVERVINDFVKDSLSANLQLYRDQLPNYYFDRFEGYVVIKGGSWKSNQNDLKIKSRELKRPERSTAYIGFRPIIVPYYPSINDF